MSSIASKSEPLTKEESDELLGYLDDLKTYKSSRLIAPEARKALWLIFENMESISVPETIRALLPQLRRALDNERRKAEQGKSLYNATWEVWFEQLSDGAFDLDREPAPTPDSTQYSVLADEVQFAQRCGELDPSIQISRVKN